MKLLYKYPQSEYPYARLVDENRRRSGTGPEFELLDTGIFDSDRYFDVFIEYAKADTEDHLHQVEVFNRGPTMRDSTSCRSCGSGIRGHGGRSRSRSRRFGVA